MIKRSALKFKNNITVKLFILLSASFILFAVALVLIQLFIVNRMCYTTSYTAAKMNSLTTVIDTVQSKYYEMQYGKDAGSKKINAMLEKYSKANKAYFLILDSNEKVQNIPEVLTKEIGKYYLNRTIDEIRNSPAKDNSTGLRITGFLGLPSKYLTVYKKIPKTYITAAAACAAATIAGTSEKNSIITGKSMSTELPAVDIVAITAEVNNSNNIRVLERYVTYVFILVVIISVLLAALFSVIITRRVVKIKNIAAKMAQLDFDEKCAVKSNDELGDLAKSLNFLSERLVAALEGLNSANRQLKRDLAFQRQVDKVRKDFIASVSHELKTPLTLIRGYTEGIQSHMISEGDYEDAHSVVIDEVDKMNRLVVELTELSALDFPDYSLNRKDFLIDDLLYDMESKYAFIAKERGITLEVMTDCDNVLIFAERFRIEQVITNFINNALVNTAAGHTITLKSCLIDDSARVSVFNEGLPINENDIDKIWTAFYRSDQSRSKKTGGSGLGLAICKAILEKHGAQYGVNNKENGVEFFFVMREKGG